MKLISILCAFLLVLGGGFMMLRPETPVDSYFAWLDWDANPPSDNVSYYTLYMGTGTNPATKMELGNQTSIRVIRNHPHQYYRLTATNSVGESQKSNEVHLVTP